MTDSEVLEAARSQSRILVTHDKDFGKLVFLRRQLTTGVVLIRLSTGDPGGIATAVSSVLDEFKDRLPGQFLVITDSRVRLRRIE